MTDRITVPKFLGEEHFEEYVCNMRTNPGLKELHKTFDLAANIRKMLM
jgi:hypothetical protein